MRSKMNGECHQAHARHTKTAISERFGQNPMVPGVRAVEDPWFADQLGNVDLAAARPTALHGGRDHQLIVANCFDVDLVCKNLSAHRPRPGQNEVESPFEQFSPLEGWS